MKTIDTETTKVKFFLERDFDENDKETFAENHVFAYFPNEMYSYDGITRSCYAHIGQHSACHPDYAKECKEATKEQYQDLKAELESIGYKLKVLNKN
jgi:hypothetical protein